MLFSTITPALSAEAILNYALCGFGRIYRSAVLSIKGNDFKSKLIKTKDFCSKRRIVIYRKPLARNSVAYSIYLERDLGIKMVHRSTSSGYLKRTISVVEISQQPQRTFRNSIHMLWLFHEQWLANSLWSENIKINRNYCPRPDKEEWETLLNSRH
jgi:hypothetical protein